MLDNGDFGSEDRFFQAFAVKHWRPYYFLGIERTEERLDAQGVDATAMIRYPGGDHVLLPVEVKSDEREFDEYYRLHPLSFRSRVVVVAAHREGDLERIRRLFFREVERRRSANVRYDDFFAKLKQEELSLRMQQRIADIREHRVARGLVTTSAPMLQAAE